MDLWPILLLLALLTGLMGWHMTPFTSGIIYWCMHYQEDMDIDWGLEAAFTLFVPFAWMFSLIEIALLYCK